MPAGDGVRTRGVDVRTFPRERRLVTAATRAGLRMTPMHGLVSVDVTDVREQLARQDPPGSLTAHVVAGVARAAAEHPEVHAYRDWRGRLVVHRHVDVATLVEIDTGRGPFPMVHVLRDADVRGVDDLGAELHEVKRTPASTGTGRRLQDPSWLLALPGAARAMYAVMARSPRARARTGSVSVTSVGMFGDGGGFALAPMTLMSLQVVVGGVAARAVVVDGVIERREMLDLTVSIDHDVVDGAPAARFVARLRELLERPAPAPDGGFTIP